MAAPVSANMAAKSSSDFCCLDFLEVEEERGLDKLEDRGFRGECVDSLRGELSFRGGTSASMSIL